MIDDVIITILVVLYHHWLNIAKILYWFFEKNRIVIGFPGDASRDPFVKKRDSNPSESNEMD